MLRDGTAAVVRPIAPEDASSLVEGLRRLSVESRVRRFFYDKVGFSRRELSNLTHCDGRTHLAFVLGILDKDGNEADTVAVARCFRSREFAAHGEVAFVTIDEWQGLGIGNILGRVLARECWEVGIRSWKASHFADNHAALRILALVGERTFKQDLGSGVVESIYTLRKPDFGIESVAASTVS